MVNARFHRRVQADLNEILAKYRDVSGELEDDFFAEFRIGIQKACENPRFFHFDASGLRRCNLERFPYHFLYDIRDGGIRTWGFATITAIRGLDFGVNRALRQRI